MPEARSSAGALASGEAFRLTLTAGVVPPLAQQFAGAAYRSSMRAASPAY